MEKVNPKELNLDKLENEKNKVTLGFKCSPQLKLHLANQAQHLGITLSEFVESIVSNYENTINKVIKAQKEKNAFYENDILMDLFNQQKNKTVEFVSASGEKMKTKIETIQDIYTVLINSFKPSKK